MAIVHTQVSSVMSICIEEVVWVVNLKNVKLKFRLNISDRIITEFE